MSTKKQIALALALVLGAAGVVAFQGMGGDAEAAQGGTEGHDHAAMLAGSNGSQPVRLDREEARRIGVALTTVERRPLVSTLQTVGIVAYDETRLVTVNPKIEGWVERLHVDFTGAPIRRGQPLMDVYSPRLVSAQEELILARRLVDETPEGSRASTNALALLESSRRRLAYWDIPADEIARIEASGEVRRALTLRAPAAGIVVEKNVVEGDRIMPGMTLYRIADLSTVWVEADVFEKDLGLVRIGQRGDVAFEAFPGRGFEARVTYVYPTVAVQSRTGRVRLELRNPGIDIKPGMYAQISLDVPPGEPAAVVPRSAVLATGERVLVFVEAADGSLVPREVTLGRSGGRYVEVLVGLEAGERVVSSAAFLVDAESNLGALGGSMDADEGSMSMDDGTTPPTPDPHAGH